MDVGYGIFWSEIGSGFGDAGGTPPLKIPKSTPPPGAAQAYYLRANINNIMQLQFHMWNSKYQW